MSRLDQLVADVLEEEGDPLGEDTPFADALAWDSLKHVELIIGIQTAFEVDLTTEEIARITNKRAARDVLSARGLVA
jgi:acyl carrier protein